MQCSMPSPLRIQRGIQPTLTAGHHSVAAGAATCQPAPCVLYKTWDAGMLAALTCCPGSTGCPAAICKGAASLACTSTPQSFHFSGLLRMMHCVLHAMQHAQPFAHPTGDPADTDCRTSQRGCRSSYMPACTMRPVQDMGCWHARSTHLLPRQHRLPCRDLQGGRLSGLHQHTSVIPLLRSATHDALCLACNAACPALCASNGGSSRH